MAVATVASVLCAPAVPAGAAAGSRVRGSGGAVFIAPLNPSDSLIAFWCSVVATYLASSVTIESCRLYADGVFVTEAEPIAVSSQAMTTSGVAGIHNDSTLTVCWDVSAEPIFAAKESHSGCTIVNTKVLAIG